MTLGRNRRTTATAPAVAGRLHPHDEVRVIRALEKLRAASPAGAGAPWPPDESAWREGGPRDYDVVYVGLTMERRALAARLEGRAAAMAQAGLAEEVDALLARGYDPALPALQGIGYREFVQVLRGMLSVATAVRLMQRDTVRYARRQGTWFAREPGIEWLDVTDERDVARTAARIERRLRKGGLI